VMAPVCENKSRKSSSLTLGERFPIYSLEFTVQPAGGLVPAPGTKVRVRVSPRAGGLPPRLRISWRMAL
jgi:hypothetical protein